MPLDPSIYQQMQPNLASQLAGSLNQFTEQRARLSDLAQQREFQQSQMARQGQLQDYQIRGLQREEAAYPAQQKIAAQEREEKAKQDIALGIYGGLSNNKTPEEINVWATQKGAEFGLPPEKMMEIIAPLRSGQDIKQTSEYYRQIAGGRKQFEREQEARIKQQYAPEKSVDEGSPVTVMQQGKPMTIMSKSGRIVGEAVPKQDTTLVQVQLPTGETIYQPRATAAGMAVPQKAGKGGAPEDVSAAKEQASLSSQQVLDQAEKLFQHPGRTAGTGASSWMGNIPGTEAKGFQANLETFKSQTFLPMVSALKGMGALSDAEGKKITASVGALDPQMPEKEFEESIKDTTRFLFNKAKAAGLDVQLPSFMNPKAVKSAQGAQTYEGDKEARYQAWKAKQGK